MTAPSPSAPDFRTRQGRAAVAGRLAYVFVVYACFAALGLIFGANGLRCLLGVVLVLALIETGGSLLGALAAIAALGLNRLSPALFDAACLMALAIMVGLVFWPRRDVVNLVPAAYHLYLALALVAMLVMPADLPWGVMVAGVFVREFLGGFIGQWGERLGVHEALICRAVSPNKGWLTYLVSSGIAFALVLGMSGSWGVAAPMLLCQWGDLANSLFKRATGQRHSGRLFGGEQGGWADSFAVFAAPLLGYQALQELGPHWAP